MTVLTHKIDFKVITSVTNANPNGDPLNGNRPRQNFEGYGEISDVAIKRKIRNRLQDMGGKIFVQSDDRADDGLKSLRDRVDSIEELNKIAADKKKADVNRFSEVACETWIDTRSFGQVFAFKGLELSVGVRGPVSIQTAVSLEPIDINTMQITKSVNSVSEGGGKSSDTMGTKHFVDFGVYVFNGSINVQLAEKTGFTETDAEKIKEALTTLFENDASSARPDGSMAVEKVYWWEHPSKMGKASSAKVHRSVKIEKIPEIDRAKSFDDYKVTAEPLEGIELTVIEGL
ncbi:CRISPR-associated protein cas7/csd2, subtype I-c/dvulg [Enterococcus moraviensis ATCC BAA-383]|uniref:CRISPR-associated protein cas7/csd2, subtype I-c/dvulg n=1 Tax=Enterococcus moraviensis ATCC BAA-383 TaxID=1158609 RepID=R2T8B9_9ENTE|nr:type I-C CRISPR-associated protein Cas7/Csd2 [Enterococcus moraviensis]EOH96444.1 CRISPR-associated protein cas7/csd2, subtype I-c/dvulg [Enterococcus moraviensis ATCC BAA-383]EOT65870.1 CRISPR-associated protein cas7/csd2, subtype I-c/dvulg [Enterococcus moraviensis ATCC BAA-383]OJG68360.1 CRISPR-associated protein cas7/csd2, subtype I-c/dvulg [Enterococcus moraviensis]